PPLPNGAPVPVTPPIPPLPKSGARLTPMDQKLIKELESYLARTAKGLPTPDPLMFKPKDYQKLLKKQGLALTPLGQIVAGPKTSPKTSAKPSTGAGK